MTKPDEEQAETANNSSEQAISVIVPRNPFVPKGKEGVQHCLAALDVEKLMDWWPGKAHSPHRKPDKVRDIQRSLDWKRVAQIAAYLLQKDIRDVPKLLNKYFNEIYEPKKTEPGREWPPHVPNTVYRQASEYPTFSNVLLHVNGARIKALDDGAAKLIFDADDKDLYLSVIDGQHRINGAYFAVQLLNESRLEEGKSKTEWEIPAEIFLDLDKRNDPPRGQAQIFIDVNFYQKKVDRSLVADLFPTARGRGPLSEKERAQDIGRKLMLEVGPLVGMIQIPGIRYGVKEVVALATLNSAIEDVLEDLERAKIEGLEAQTEFIAHCLDAWLEATGRKHDLAESPTLDPENVVYQGRAVVSFLTLMPACIWKIRKEAAVLTSRAAGTVLVPWLAGLMRRAGLMKNGKFLNKTQFKEKGFLGSGGLARFRDSLWAAAIGTKSLGRISVKRLTDLAAHNRSEIRKALGQDDDSAGS